MFVIGDQVSKYSGQMIQSEAVSTRSRLFVIFFSQFQSTLYNHKHFLHGPNQDKIKLEIWCRLRIPSLLDHKFVDVD